MHLSKNTPPRADIPHVTPPLHTSAQTFPLPIDNTMPSFSAHASALPNLRDVGGQPISSTAATRHGLLYRSAAPRATAPAALAALSITVVYDLRSAVEIDREGGVPATEAACTTPSCARRHVPVFTVDDYTPEAIALRYKDYGAADTTAGFVAAYKAILKSGAKSAFAPVLKHLAATDPTPCLVHCTAGKDRTGLLCAIVLSLCGVDDQHVADEYALTEEGLAPLKPGIMARLIAAAPAHGLDVDSAARMLSSKCVAHLPN